MKWGKLALIVHRSCTVFAAKRRVFAGIQRMKVVFRGPNEIDNFADNFYLPLPNDSRHWTVVDNVVLGINGARPKPDDVEVGLEVAD